MQSLKAGALSAVLAMIMTPAAAQTAKDPGIRGGPPGAGGPLSGADAAYFAAAAGVFREVDSVSGTIEPGKGLGPRFNANSCAACHAYPAVGGSSPLSNPQIGIATLDGAQNTIPSFITPNGPVREARFINATKSAGNNDQQAGHGNGQNGKENLDGGVHDLFTITGRSDAPGCNIAQPDFASELANNNVIFRIPTPVFGLGLVEDTPDSTLIANAKPGAHFNHSGNDGTITRFGWKAQNKSLEIFVGEAYNVEQGVTNELFPNERDTTPSCQFNATPEDIATSTPADTTFFAAFARYSAPPVSVPSAFPDTARGQQVFASVGCASCHVPKQTTHGGVDYFPYSDFALHHMGDLADGIIQGNAGPDEFRTAPLWGIGQRAFFLHDGRTSDLVQAIQAHQSGSGNQSEGNTSVKNFNALSVADQQALLDFLRSQ